MDVPGHGKPCTGSNFLPQSGPGSTVYTNHQELRVQEQMQCLEPGSVPASIAITVQDELADCCQPGGRVHCQHTAPARHIIDMSCCMLWCTSASAACPQVPLHSTSAARLRPFHIGYVCHACMLCLQCAHAMPGVPADDVEVTGIVRAQWRPLFPGARCDGTLILHACHMRTVNSLHRAVAPPPEGLAEQFRWVVWLVMTACWH